MKSKLGFLVKYSFNRKAKSKWFLIANIILAIVIVALFNIDTIISKLGGDFNKGTKFQPVLNFDFSTHVLFRCTQKKYANDFLKGKFRFNQPKAWIKMENDGNKGQGDSLEGVCLATNKDDNSEFIKNMKN